MVARLYKKIKGRKVEVIRQQRQVDVGRKPRETTSTPSYFRDNATVVLVLS